MNTLLRIAIGVLLLATKTLVLGADFSLSFDSLPSAQGWTFRTDGPSEAQAYSVDGGKLIMHTIGTGAANVGYEVDNVVDRLRPFTISLRARVLRTEVLDPSFAASTLVVSASTGADVSGFGLNTRSIHAPLFSGQIHPLDATRFHDYRLEGGLGAEVRTFVDGVLFATGSPLSFPNPDALLLLNGSFEKGDAEITAFSFLQPVPEPRTDLLILAGLVGLAMRWRLVGRRG
jgi:hypothetical protein